MSNTVSRKLVNQALKIRIYPTQEQKDFLDKTFGCARFVYNYYLNEKNTFYKEHILPIRESFDYSKNLSKYNELCKKQNKSKEEKQEQKSLKGLLTKIREISNAEYKNFKKKSPKELKSVYPWLKESNSQALCAAQMNVDTAFKNFYEGRTDFPKFHSKKQNQSFKDCMMKQNLLDWNSREVELPKVGKIKFRNRSLPKCYKNRVRVCSYTCSKTKSNEYYISILFEVEISFIQKSKVQNIDESQVIGLDFDCDDMYVDSKRKSSNFYLVS